MPKQKVKVGDVFWVPIEDGSFVLGQIVEDECEVLNSIACVFFDCRVSPKETNEVNFDYPISCQFVTRDLFNSGVWKRINNLPNQINDELLPYRKTKEDGWIGAKIRGSGVIRKFLSAYYGLRDWNEMHDPNYYQELLLKGVLREIIV